MAEIALAGATVVLRQTLGGLSNLVVQEGSRLSRLREDIVWIESEMRHIQAYSEDAEAKQESSRGVANLVIDIRDLAHDVEDIMQKYFPRIASPRRKGFLGYLKDAISHAYAARAFVMEIEEIKRRVENINRVRQTYGINEFSGGARRDIWDERRSFPHVDEPNVVGIEEHIQKLVAKMRNGELQCRVISIIGMAGLGKTTLAKKVYNSVQRNFGRSAWICISQQPNVNELLRDIARQAGLEKKKWKDNFEANLYTFLSQNRYVIVIDDIWHTEIWDAIKNVIPTNSENGSRIILTSRNRDVGVHVGGWSSLHELLPLDLKNSRELFKMLMGHPQTMNETSDMPQFENIGEKILKRCGGVPLAIVLAAGLLKLKGRSENEWNGVLEEMGQAQGQCAEIFALSYKDLPTKLKPCFLYFGLFPEDYIISAFELINLWAAEGFIRGSGVREVEDVGDDYLNHLIARNLIQVVQRRFNGKVKTCRIHDILHSLCIRVSKEINFFNTHSDVNTYNPALRVRRVTTHGSDFGDYISLNHQTPKLRAMLAFRGDLETLRRKKCVDNFLQDFKFLRVLGVNLSCSLPIPNQVDNFRNLSYLGLKWRSNGEIVELPCTISNLKNLLTLDVRGCFHVILPNVIWNMKQLRHILLPYRCEAPALSEISLPNLQTLHELPPALLEADVLKLTNLRTLRVDLPTKRIIEVLSDATPISHRLQKLWLSTKGIEMSTTLNLSRYDNLCKLHLENVSMIKLPQYEELPQNLTNLTLKFTELQYDPMDTLKKLPKLKILKLHDRSYVGINMGCYGATGNFPQLEVLEIRKLRNLEQFIITERKMPKLKELRILWCNTMTKVPERISQKMIIIN